MPAPTTVVSHRDCAAHVTGPGHPESPRRLTTLLAALDALLSGSDGRITRTDGRPATKEELALAHPTSHIESIENAALQASRAERLLYLDPDTVVSPGSWDAALAAAGSVLTAVDLLIAGAVANAFCAVRPPGHHATTDRAMGFCLFNNVAIGVRYAQRKGLQRALIIDWDVHHGNGTEAIFYTDPDVFYLSMHQSPHYPGTGVASDRGRGPGEGTTLNLPVPPGWPPKRYVDQLLEGIATALSTFTPDILFISSGFDAAYGDPLAGLTLAPADYHELTSRILEQAASLCAGRVVSVLEGGYDLEVLAACGDAHVRALAGMGRF
jgi:acetoin utilization deacetylase AcuC-like enzyme